MRTKITFPTDNMPPFQNTASKPCHASERKSEGCGSYISIPSPRSRRNMIGRRKSELAVLRHREKNRCCMRIWLAALEKQQITPQLTQPELQHYQRHGSNDYRSAIHNTRATQNNTPHTHNQGSLQCTWSSQVVRVTVRTPSPPFPSTKHSLPFMPKSVKLLERKEARKEDI